MRRCKVCGNDEDPHLFRHPFIAEDSPMEAGSVIKNDKKQKTEGNKPPMQVSAGTVGDPVLRLALINAGVLTYGDLVKAEEVLKHARASGTPAIATPPGAADPAPGSTEPSRSA